MQRRMLGKPLGPVEMHHHHNLSRFELPVRSTQQSYALSLSNWPVSWSRQNLALFSCILDFSRSLFQYNCNH